MFGLRKPGKQPAGPLPTPAGIPSPPPGHTLWDAAAWAEADRQAGEKWRASSAELLNSLLALSVSERLAVPDDELDCLTPEDLSAFRGSLPADARREGAESAREKGRGAAEAFLAAVRSAGDRALAAIQPDPKPPEDAFEKLIWRVHTFLDDVRILAWESLLVVGGWGRRLFWRTRILWAAICGFAAMVQAPGMLGPRLRELGILLPAETLSDASLLAGVCFGAALAWGLGLAFRTGSRLGDAAATAAWLAVAVWWASAGRFDGYLPLAGTILLSVSAGLAFWVGYTLVSRRRK
ncbi:hypothetical protein [Azospirillum sp. TSO5]|uniref:hypothetical protein n=1 Tax=Azospirillum sp. TSO5 TaxID=716760 RepID=UPI000D658ECF|nr:hypothetical protein [Azospirillum sp. TSO5]